MADAAATTRQKALSLNLDGTTLYLSLASVFIAQAGGITANGDRNKVMLLRGDGVVVSALGPGTVLQNSPIQSGDQIFVPLRSWMSRNGQTFFVAALSVTTAVLVAVLVRR